MLITPPAVTAQLDSGSGQLDVNAAFMEQAQPPPLQQQPPPQQPQQPLLVRQFNSHTGKTDKILKMTTTRKKTFIWLHYNSNIFIYCQKHLCTLVVTFLAL